MTMSVYCIGTLKLSDYQTFGLLNLQVIQLPQLVFFSPTNSIIELKNNAALIAIYVKCNVNTKHQLHTASLPKFLTC